MIYTGTVYSQNEAPAAAAIAPSLALLRNWISFGARGSVSTSRDVPVCSVNQSFPSGTCLKLFKLSARSLGGRLKVSR